MARGTKETSLAAARALFSKPPDPPPEPTNIRDGLIFEYAQATVDWVPPGCVLIVHGKALDERGVERLRKAIEGLQADAIGSRPITLPGNVQLVPLPEQLNAGGFMKKLMRRDISLAIEHSPELIVHPEYVEIGDDIPTHFCKQVTVKGRVLDSHRGAGRFPVIRPEDCGVEVVSVLDMGFDDSMPVSGDGALRIELELAVPKDAVPEVPKLGAREIASDKWTFRVEERAMTTEIGQYREQVTPDSVLVNELGREFLAELELQRQRGDIAGYSRVTFTKDKDIFRSVKIIAGLARVAIPEDPEAFRRDMDLIGEPARRAIGRTIESHMEANRDYQRIEVIKPQASTPMLPRSGYDSATDTYVALQPNPFATPSDFPTLFTQVPPEHAHCRTHAPMLGLPKPGEMWTDGRQILWITDVDVDKNEIHVAYEQGGDAYQDTRGLDGFMANNFPTDPGQAQPKDLAKPFPRLGSIWGRQGKELVVVTKVVRNKDPGETTITATPVESGKRWFGPKVKLKLAEFWNDYDYVRDSQESK
jgi:hypothetical protein